MPEPRAALGMKMLMARSLAAGASRFTGSLKTIALAGIETAGRAAERERAIRAGDNRRPLLAAGDVGGADLQGLLPVSVREAHAQRIGSDAGVDNLAQCLIREEQLRGFAVALRREVAEPGSRPRLPPSDRKNWMKRRARRRQTQKERRLRFAYCQSLIVSRVSAC